MKVQKKSWRPVGGVQLGGHGGCERRIEVIVKMQKKNLGGGGGGPGRGQGSGRGGGQGGWM